VDSVTYLSIRVRAAEASQEQLVHVNIFYVVLFSVGAASPTVFNQEHTLTVINQ